MADPYRVIELTQGYVAIISAEDFRRVNRHKWRVHFSAGTKRKPGKPYARATIKGKDTYLHRFIAQPEDGQHTDHDNHQTLDCRRPNLINCTHKENMANRRTKANPKGLTCRSSCSPIQLQA